MSGGKIVIAAPGGVVVDGTAEKFIRFSGVLFRVKRQPHGELKSFGVQAAGGDIATVEMQGDLAGHHVDAKVIRLAAAAVKWVEKIVRTVTRAAPGSVVSEGDDGQLVYHGVTLDIG